jgi:archaeosine synthase beta-subunit
MRIEGSSMPSIPPEASGIDDAWILQRRPRKNTVDPDRPYAFLVEKEHAATGRVEDVATLFLTNKECPLRCLMCDLWKNTTDVAVRPGQIPEQIRWSLDRLPQAKHIKLYNSGNFFDTNAIPEVDDPHIAELMSPFDTVVVESHPRMIGRRCLAFNAVVRGHVQVAIGLETVHPQTLDALNKHMTLDDFQSSVRTLTDNGMSARTFILLRPPFMTETEGVEWAKRSIDFAFDSGVECCAVIPTRGGNGALDELSARGLFASPTLDSLEEVLTYGLQCARGRVFADLWDAERFTGGDDVARVDRLKQMNLTQTVIDEDSWREA